ncbi:TonB-dependent siderophore receptor [Pseudomonas putida CSV86]|uniref:Ligand-gated channel n=2 Tax=Pseudomonas TaxID=286 RepID=A0A177SL24_PSEPU|nr:MULTISPECIES: TonB-dependent siderophore receptor [Pseudomonas]MDG9881877.1 TonB-dependent siderophore receptor [Pseudomonas sp. GD04058]NNJ14533.1 TonB-dependent siderophore receptor [Pseudomonas bharatica CSV86]OAI91234.1 ligand-gated channel [Pseudomonas putida]
MHTPSRLTPLSKALLLRQAAFGLALTLPFAAQAYAQEAEAETEAQAANGAPATLNLAPTNINSQVLGTTTENTGSYTTGAVTIGKAAQSLRETPQSVTVMTRQLMDDKNLTSLDQVLSKTPGLSFSQRNFGSHVYQSRGFVLSEDSYMIDGIPGQAYNMSGWMAPDMAIYDRVEVLRGASGLLVGAGNPGGAVNLVRKRATSEPQFSITTRAGSYDNYRVDLDGSGRLNDQGTLRGRFVTAYEDKGSWLDEYSAKTPLLYGVLEADLADDTTLTMSLRRQEKRIDGYSIWALPRYSNGQSLDISRSTALVQDWNHLNTNMTEAFLELNHRFNDNWSNKTSFTWSKADLDMVAAYGNGAINPVTQRGSVFQNVEFRHTNVESVGIDSFMDGHFEAFGQSHQVTLGANWSRQDVTERRAPYRRATPIPINIFDVDHHAFAKPQRPAWSLVSEYVDERSGIYANTRLHLTEPLSLVLGTRVSWYKYDYDQKLGAGNDYLTQQNREVTPFAGLIYDFSEHWSWYASYADIFKPQNDRTWDGSPLDPAIGTNYETGIKGELFDKRLNLSAAVFYIKQEDLAINDPDETHLCPSNPSMTCQINGLVQRSKGIDLEASGEVLPGLEVLAGYTYNRIVSPQSNALTTDTPKHLARISTSYTPQDGEWNRLTVGAGVSAQSRYENKLAGGYDYGSPGRAIWDARIGWKIDEHWKVNLTGENLFDRKYWSTASGLNRGNVWGDPRTFMLSLRGDF